MISRWVFTCEHGGNNIPQAYAHLFQDAEANEALDSHKGWDPGALQLFRQIEPMADFSISSTTSRLLVELNRSLHNPMLFSSFSADVSAAERQAILNEHYYPYRQEAEKAIQGFIENGEKVYHLSIHSFTPVLNGDVRKADIGLLYDPSRQQEKQLCSSWKNILNELLPQMIVRNNYPYKGTDDGFTTYLRRKFPFNYAGVELELNQKWAGDEGIYDRLHQSVKALKERFDHR